MEVSFTEGLNSTLCSEEKGKYISLYQMKSQALVVNVFKQSDLLVAILVPKTESEGNEYHSCLIIIII